MPLDVPTLFVVAVFCLAMASAVLFFSWTQSRAVTALAWWAAGYGSGALGTALLSLRGKIPDLWSINLANALLLAACGCIWCGVRRFDGRHAPLAYALAASMLWLVACSVPTFYASMASRIILISSLTAVYAGLAAWELWRGRHDGLASRWPAMVLAGGHGAMCLVRVPITLLYIPPDGIDFFQVPFLAFGMLESLLHSFCTAFILVAMAKERAEKRHRRAAELDPLTDVPNRRGFFDLAQRMIDRSAVARRPLALLVLDLDHFKSVNDTFGHHVGDVVLTSFCRGVQPWLGPQDLFGRLGGEEFVALIPLDGGRSASEWAERIRDDFGASPFTVGEERVHATVSIGVATTTEAGYDLSALLAAADKALYRAKAKGRNRVEFRPPLILVPAAS